MKDINCLFENNALHDYEVDKMIVDYSNGSIEINLITDKLQSMEIIVNNFKSITFSKNEPWGKGKYVVSSDAKNVNNKCVLEFQLNSGDTCTM
jgi:hypothetical protein